MYLLAYQKHGWTSRCSVWKFAPDSRGWQRSISGVLLIHRQKINSSKILIRLTHPFVYLHYRHKQRQRRRTEMREEEMVGRERERERERWGLCTDTNDFWPPPDKQPDFQSLCVPLLQLLSVHRLRSIASHHYFGGISFYHHVPSFCANTPSPGPYFFVTFFPPVSSSLFSTFPFVPSSLVSPPLHPPFLSLYSSSHILFLPFLFLPLLFCSLHPPTWYLVLSFPPSITFPFVSSPSLLFSPLFCFLFISLSYCLLSFAPLSSSSFFIFILILLSLLTCLIFFTFSSSFLPLPLFPFLLCLLYTVFLFLPLLTSLLFLHSHFISPLPYWLSLISYHISFPFLFILVYFLLYFASVLPFSFCPFFPNLFFFFFPFLPLVFPSPLFCSLFFSSCFSCRALALHFLSSLLLLCFYLTAPFLFLFIHFFFYLIFSRPPPLSLSTHILFSCCLPQFNFLFFSFVHFLICSSYLCSPLPF